MSIDWSVSNWTVASSPIWYPTLPVSPTLKTRFPSSVVIISGLSVLGSPAVQHVGRGSAGCDDEGRAIWQACSMAVCQLQGWHKNVLQIETVHPKTRTRPPLEPRSRQIVCQGAAVLLASLTRRHPPRGTQALSALRTVPGPQETAPPGMTCPSKARRGRTITHLPAMAAGSPLGRRGKGGEERN